VKHAPTEREWIRPVLAHAGMLAAARRLAVDRNQKFGHLPRRFIRNADGAQKPNGSLPLAPFDGGLEIVNQGEAFQDVGNEFAAVPRRAVWHRRIVADGVNKACALHARRLPAASKHRSTCVNPGLRSLPDRSVDTFCFVSKKRIGSPG
jgi:hypothetical protein